MIRVNWKAYAVVSAAAFLIGLILSSRTTTSNGEHVVHESVIERIRHDTAYRIVTITPKPLKVTARASGLHPIRLHDTIYQQICLDTLLVGLDSTATGPDTLSLCYTPLTELGGRAAGRFDVSLRSSPRCYNEVIPYEARDSLFSRIDSFRSAQSTERNWYDELLLIVVSVAAGIVLSRL